MFSWVAAIELNMGMRQRHTVLGASLHSLGLNCDNTSRRRRYLQLDAPELSSPSDFGMRRLLFGTAQPCVFVAGPGGFMLRAAL
jgi:hypothetical protein